MDWNKTGQILKGFTSLINKMFLCRSCIIFRIHLARHKLYIARKD